MNGHRRIGPATLANKIALLFCAITVVSFGTTFLYVVPRLEANLESRTLADAKRQAELTAPDLEELIDTNLDWDLLDERVREVADKSGARVTLLGVDREEPPEKQLYGLSDSLVGKEIDLSYDVAHLAKSSRDVESAIGLDGPDEVAQVAVPMSSQGGLSEWIVLFTRPLDDARAAVALIRGQVIVAGIIALVISLVGGYLVARALARRVRRLEQAARDVAARRDVQPLPIDSDDELGQLTRTFNEMQVQLDRVDKARRDFIANASHELRTPIFSLAGFAELLESEDLDSETRAQFVHQIRVQTERLRKLAVELLDLSRLDAGSLEIHPERVDLSELARTVVGEFEPAMAGHGSNLDLRLPKDDVSAWCDPARVAQIMRILLDNALRHTPDGTRVRVSAGCRNGTAEFAVADTGEGMPPPAQERAFDRFFTADAASGSGLGLAIAKELADRMDGRITLRSRPGDTTFTLSLPVSGEDHSAEDGGR
jgi:signal transduction histidine kinase